MPVDRSLFPEPKLPDEVVATLERLNPWWLDEPIPSVPPVRRHFVGRVRSRIDLGMTPIVAVRGPRQVGKTTALLQIIRDLLDEGVDPHNILRVQFDELPSLEFSLDPVLAIVRWFERKIASASFNALAQAGQMAYIFFDELQNVYKWSPQIKFLVDTSSVKVFVTGSSALRIARGLDTLVGRISMQEAGTLSLTEIGLLRGLESPAPFLEDNGIAVLKTKDFWQGLAAHGEQHKAFREEVFQLFSERGGYPVVHNEPTKPWEKMAQDLNDNVVRRVIQHDSRVGDAGVGAREAGIQEAGPARNEELIAEIFRLTCRYAGDTPAIAKLAREAHNQTRESVKEDAVWSCLRFLEDTLLLRLIPPLEIRRKRNSGIHKLCLADHGLRASWLQERVSLAPKQLAADPSQASLAGHLAESAFGAAVSTIVGLGVNHFPARKDAPEVDFVLTVGDSRIPAEVKYTQRVGPADVSGLLSFLEQPANRAPFGLLITRDAVGSGKAGSRGGAAHDCPGDFGISDLDDRIIALPLSSFLLLQ